MQQGLNGKVSINAKYRVANLKRYFFRVRHILKTSEKSIFAMV